MACVWGGMELPNARELVPKDADEVDLPIPRLSPKLLLWCFCDSSTWCRIASTCSMSKP